VKQYVLSSANAFESWFEASMEIIGIYQTLGIRAARSGNERFFWNVQSAARDVAAGWSLVFTNESASKAILLGPSKDAKDDATKERAKWIISKLSKVLPRFPDDSPDNSAVEGQTNMFTAMIELRLEQFGVEVGDYQKLLGLRGVAKQMYNDMAIPFAVGTIAKGRMLTTAESQQALMNHAHSGGGQRRAKGKKGKKNRS